MKNLIFPLGMLFGVGIVLFSIVNLFIWVSFWSEVGFFWEYWRQITWQLPVTMILSGLLSIIINVVTFFRVAQEVEEFEDQ